MATKKKAAVVKPAAPKLVPKVAKKKAPAKPKPKAGPSGSDQDTSNAQAWESGIGFQCAKDESK